MAETQWDVPFSSGNCNEEPDDNIIVVMTMLLSNLSLLFAIIYCFYMKAVLTISHDFNKLVETHDPALLHLHRYPQSNPYTTEDLPLARTNPQSVPTQFIDLAQYRYPTPNTETLAHIISSKGRNPSPQMTWNSVYFAMRMIVSFVYHSCQVAEFCSFGGLDVVHPIDRISANYLVSIIIIMFVERFNTNWIVSAGSFYFLFSILLEFTFPCSYISTVMNIIIGTLFFMLNLIVIREGRMDHEDRFSYRDIGISGILCTAGITLYMLDHYSYTHPPWHLLAGLGATAALTGTNRDLPYSPTFFELLRKSPRIFMDGILLPGYQFIPRTAP